MKKYNVVLKKNGQLIMSFITYDRKVERKILKAMQKLKIIVILRRYQNDRRNR